MLILAPNVGIDADTITINIISDTQKYPNGV